MDMPLYRLDCTHFFCVPCLMGWARNRLKNSEEITCPSICCQKPIINHSDLKLFLREKFEPYLNIQIKRKLSQDTDFFWCPFCSSGYYIDESCCSAHEEKKEEKEKVTTSSTASTSSTSTTPENITPIPTNTTTPSPSIPKFLTCPDCKVATCRSCKWVAHDGISCEEALERLKQHRKLDFQSDLWKVQNAKKCPNCTAFIEKNSGCSHMRCTSCKFEFCWLCMRKYGGRHTTGDVCPCNS